tara:strand:- start:75 stop:545 length:471 start_codon:yes stop_codon:yes gene_type:complete
MGDRVNVIIHNKQKTEFSPVIYSHWGGDSVAWLLETMREEYSTKHKTEDLNWSVGYRLEIPRVFTKLVSKMVKESLEPQVYNWDSSKYAKKKELPLPNDLPIIADDRGCYFLEVESLQFKNVPYDWDLDEWRWSTQQKMKPLKKFLYKIKTLLKRS